MNYIAIIDDSITIRSTIKLVLKNLNYAVAESQNGQEALEKIKEIKEAGNDIALCIVDVNMPVMDGITFLREFRKSDKFTPVLMLTTESQENLIEQAKELGASGWIIKPFQPDKLIDTIKKFVK